MGAIAGHEVRAYARAPGASGTVGDMVLPASGVDRDQLFAELDAMKDGDVRWRDGRAFTLAYHAGDDVVFEADWDGERVWRWGPAGFVQVGAADNDNSPCALADGRIASLYLGRPGNTTGRHELKLMAADGRELAMLVIGRDIVDDGLGCGG